MTEIRIPYAFNGRQFEGVIIHADHLRGSRPAVFVQPDWKGVCEHTIAQAREVAGDDCVVLLADMYGVDYHGEARTREQLATGMRAIHRDLPFTVGCGGYAYSVLLAAAKARGLVDGTQVAALGYCAGGGFVLEQARTGLDWQGVVVFHVTNPNPVVAGTPCNIKGRVLAVHGSADPVTPKSMMDAFETELTDARVDWQIMNFGGAVHSFCDPTANFGPSQYDEKLCRQSYRLMRDFFGEVFAE